MFELKSTTRPVRKALLVGVYTHEEPRDEAESLLQELRELVDTLGLTVLDQLMVKADPMQAKLLVGSGKAEEIIAHSKEHKADVIIFDHALTPGQQRNWEKMSELAVTDREGIILDIFARRARTREARLQVELAQMEYSLPRLTRAWGHLSRQGGSGFGAMGAGETQLETDKRLVRKRIDTLKRELADIRLQRATRRKQRQRRPTPHAAIVGYTNAGKSCLFRTLTGEQVLVEDKLFATLDTTTRKIQLPDGQVLLMTDTVGFVRKLPHRLVESFKATLEESILADFLVHVLDVSNPAVMEFYDTTMKVLEELGADMKRILTVFNKIDLITDPGVLSNLQRHFPDAMFVSALTGEGLDDLRGRMTDLLADRIAKRTYLVPASRYDLISLIHRNGSVLDEKYEGEMVRVTATLPPKLLPQFESYLTDQQPDTASPEAGITDDIASGDKSEKISPELESPVEADVTRTK
jgi:GTPase